MMLAHVIEDMLIENGITPPEKGYRTSCPNCSDMRRKRQQRCLKITIDHDREMISWQCFHCKIEGYTT